MNTKHEGLTAAEQRYLEHAEAARGEGVSLRQYYRAAGLSEASLYGVRRKLIRKGIVAARYRRPDRGAKKADPFVAVQMSTTSSGPMCRLRHPSGWVIECTQWPETNWMAALLGERG
jgi:hypothetical protein